MLHLLSCIMEGGMHLFCYSHTHFRLFAGRTVTLTPAEDVFRSREKQSASCFQTILQQEHTGWKYYNPKVLAVIFIVFMGISLDLYHPHGLGYLKLTAVNMCC
jgi:hypothetical protein